MAVQTNVIVLGRVARVSVREGKIKNGARQGEPYKITSVLIIGSVVTAQCELNEALGIPEVGALVAARASVGVFREDDQLRIEEWVDPATVLKAA